MSKTEEWIDEILNTVGMPLRSSSLFYSTYYLSEIEGNKEADFDLFRLTDELYSGFYKFGIHSLIVELSNMGSRFVINSNSLKNIGRSAIRRYTDKNIPSEYRDTALKIMMASANNNLIGGHSRGTMRRGFSDVNDIVNIFDNQEHFIETTKHLFKQEAVDSTGASVRKKNTSEGNYTGWTAGFGGGGWSRIADFLSRHGDMTKIMWVDFAWGIQHNTNNWINKVTVEHEERKRLANAGFEPPDKWYDSTEDISSVDVRQLVTTGVLDPNKKGDMGSVFKFATLYNDHVGVDLRRHWRRFR